MSYPQLSSDKYLIAGYQFFRLNTMLSSPGDIYESVVGGLTFALGPESDISKVNIAYFDTQSPQLMSRLAIGPQRVFQGLLPAANTLNYMPSGRPGRIFMWSDDLYDPNFRPTGFNGATDTIQFVTPVMDVLQYFASTVTPSQRNDKEFFFQAFPVPIGGTFNLVIPVYGRKYTEILATNRSGSPVNYAIIGINFAITDDSGTPTHQLTTIRASAAVADTAQVKTLVRDAVDGQYDVLLFQVDGSLIFKMTTSDVVA